MKNNSVVFQCRTLMQYAAFRVKLDKIRDKNNEEIVLK